MALGTAEKELLRMAICEGMFSSNAQAQAQPGLKIPLTADILTAISEMADEDLRRVLTAYQAQKGLSILYAISKLDSQKSALQGTLDFINSVTIGG